jgi:ribokinase
MPKVLTIGTATHDVFLQSSFFKVFRDPEHLERMGFRTGEAECFAFGAKIEVDKPIFSPGGGAYNAGVTFARQGLKTIALCKVGSDRLGDEIVKSLKNEHISSLVSRDKKVGTGYSTILLAPGGERTILVYRGAAGTLQKNDIPFSKLSAEWAYIVPGDIPFSTLFSILTALKRNKTKIAINPSRYLLHIKKSDLYRILELCQVVIVNREEASFMTDVKYTDERGIFKRFDELVSGIAVVTDGRRGAVVSDGSYIYRAGIFEEKKVIDRTGAGDAFGSGFIAGLIQKNDIHYALRLAAANATSVVEHIGATHGILTRKEFSKKRWGLLNLDVENT